MDNFTKILIEHEGKQRSAYQDSLGYWSIGIGRCIDKRKACGLSDDEMMYLLNNDVVNSRKELSHYEWFNTLDEVRQDVLVELHFNIGLDKLLQFHQTLAAIENKDFKAAAMHLLNSMWAIQVGKVRSQNMANRLESGHY